MGSIKIATWIVGFILWVTSTILRLCAYCCSAELLFISAEHFLALPSIFWLCRVFFSAIPRAFFSYSEPFSVLPSIFLPCWSLVAFAKQVSSVLSTSQLFRAFFGHTKHFSTLPSICLLCWAFVSVLRSIIRLCWALPSFLFQAFFFWYAVFFCSAVYFSALLCTAWHRRKMLGRAE